MGNGGTGTYTDFSLNPQNVQAAGMLVKERFITMPTMYRVRKPNSKLKVSLKEWALRTVQNPKTVATLIQYMCAHLLAHCLCPATPMIQLFFAMNPMKLWAPSS